MKKAVNSSYYDSLNLYSRYSAVSNAVSTVKANPKSVLFSSLMLMCAMCMCYLRMCGSGAL